MSVQSHLTSTASNLVLTSTENTNIATSVSTLQKRLNDYFSTNLLSHFMFGSNTRGTILPRKVDSNSDVDYMLVFDNSGNKKPQSFLDRVKKFAENKYSTSEIYQSHPTIVLELNHIKFELVPAYKDSWGNYYIPKKGNWGDEWIRTDPNDINKKLTEKNTSHNSLIKPLIRLMKYWNAKSGVYKSFELEVYITNHYFFTKNIKDMLYAVVDGLSTGHLTQTHKDKVDRLKTIINNTRNYENNTSPLSWLLAEPEIKKAFPEYNG